MIGELEALVGNLFVVGGRAISAPPPARAGSIRQLSVLVASGAQAGGSQQA